MFRLSSSVCAVITADKANRLHHQLLLQFTEQLVGSK
jgi:hypothetical protein